MKVAWLAPYPVQSLEPELTLVRPPKSFHPCSWVVNLSRELVRLPGLELHLITESSLVARTQSVVKGGIHFHVVKAGVPFTSRGFPGWLPFEPLMRFKPNSLRLNAVLRQIQPDLIHSHGTEAGYTRAGIDSGKPCLISIQGVIAECYKAAPELWLRLVVPCERSQVQAGKFFACRTHFDSGFIRQINPRARLFELHEAMNPLYFQSRWQPANPPSLLYVGALTDAKGADVAVAGFILIAAKHPAARLQMVGSGPASYVEALKQRLAQHSLTDRVEFLGRKDAAEIQKLHERCSVFLTSTRNDNSPNALAEAMVSGVPVIASNVGGIPSMIEDGRTGLLFETGNAAALAAALDKILSDQALSQRLAAEAKIIARQRHQPEAVARATFAAYQSILSETSQT